jgi:hypothetical protein
LARIDYEVDAESLAVPMRRVPSLPAGGVELRAFPSPHGVDRHGSG